MEEKKRGWWRRDVRYKSENMEEENQNYTGILKIERRIDTMGRTGEEKGGGLRQGDEGKKIRNLSDNERKIILCRN